MARQIQIDLFQPHEKQFEVIDSLEDPSIFYTILVSGRQIGKTLLGLNMAVKWAADNPKQTIYWVSPTDSQCHKCYIQMKDAIIESGIVKSYKGASSDTEIVLINKSRILFRSALSEDGLRGEAVNYMILDEAAFIKKSTVDMILSPMLAVKGKKLFAMSTPKGKNWLHDWYLNGVTLPKWKSFRFSTYDSPYANAELIDMWRDTLPEKMFQQEVLAEFVDSASVFGNIDSVMVLDKLEDPNPNDQYYAGIDIGIINDASVLCIMNQRGELVNFYRWTNTEAPELINAMLELNTKWKFRKMLIENNNQGLTIYHDMRRRVNNVEEFNTNSRTKGEIINALLHAFNMNTIKLCIDDLLRIELEAFIFKQKDGRIKFEAESGFSDDIVMALAIVQECYEQYKGLKFDPKRVGIFTAKVNMKPKDRY